MTDWRDRARKAAEKVYPYHLSDLDRKMAEAVYLAGVENAAEILEAICDGKCGGNCSAAKFAAAIRASVKVKP